MEDTEKPRAKRFNRVRVFYRMYRKRLIAGFVVIAHIAGGLTSLEAVMQNRTPQGAVAWAISLNLFPYAAVPAYWTFGHSEFDGYTVARRSNSGKFQPIRETFQDSLEENDLIAEPSDKLEETMVALAEMPFTRGNETEVLIDGEQTFASMLEAISSAEKYILFQFYIVRDDKTGRKFKDALIAKAKEGVKVYFLYDEIGSLSLPESYVRELSDAGVEIHPFTTSQGDGRKFQINFRNHRKIVVVDGKTGFAGGLNIGDDYIGENEELSPWRDTHLRVTGPAAVSLQAPFAEDWYWETGKLLDHLDWKAQASPGGDTEVLCLPSGPADPLDTCNLFFLSAINHAEDRLWIATPYFVPDLSIISALQMAALRGVDVRIIIPEKNDSHLIGLSSYSFLKDMETAGIRTFHHQKGFMHQKVMLVDDDFSCVGSANMDNRSFRLNFEITLVVKGKSFASKMETMLEADLGDSIEVGASSYTSKPFYFRLASRISRLLAPIL